MASGDLKRPRRREQAAVRDAVDRAEATTGLQFCVYIGRIDDDHPREQAEAVFVESGLEEVPAVLIVVAPKARRVEVVVGSHARDRITDDDAAAAIASMTGAFLRGALTDGLIAALADLATRAGPRPALAEGAELPDVVGEV